MSHGHYDLLIIMPYDLYAPIDGRLQSAEIFDLIFTPVLSTYNV